MRCAVFGVRCSPCDVHIRSVWNERGSLRAGDEEEEGEGEKEEEEGEGEKEAVALIGQDWIHCPIPRATMTRASHTHLKETKGGC